MKSIGIVEGFFGPAWPDHDRKSYADFLAKYECDFYIYAPKQDAHLRKGWRETWDSDYLKKLEDLKSHFKNRGIQFGLGFSPIGLGTALTPADKEKLKEKLTILNKLEIDILGVFFDDMPITENLADVQIQTVDIIKQYFKQKIIFCPSFYSYDPILEKVFGKMPEGYLPKIATNITPDIAVAWTGPKVISPVIDAAHMNEVTTLLKREPFIWENFFANDGPKNCKFLKLKPFTGRELAAVENMEGIALNLMNQPQLSQILFLASLNVLRGEADAKIAYERAVSELCTSDFASFLLNHGETFLTKGLDVITESEKHDFIQTLSQMEDLGAKEVLSWLKGEYVVGPECLTD